MNKSKVSGVLLESDDVIRIFRIGRRMSSTFRVYKHPSRHSKDRMHRVLAGMYRQDVAHATLVDNGTLVMIKYFYVDTRPYSQLSYETPNLKS